MNGRIALHAPPARAAPRPAGHRRFQGWFAPALGLAAFLGLWELGARLTGVAAMLLPPPSAVPAVWWGELTGGYWLEAVRSSLGHYALGLALGSFLGVVLGLLAGLSRAVEASQSWVVRVLRPIPGLAWVPFAIIWFGVTPTAATFIIAVAVFWINYFAALAAVQAIDKDLYEVAEAFGHGGFVARLTKIALPGALPGILAGFRTGLGQAWMAVVAAELFGVPGVGARMMQAASLLATDVVLVYMLTMALLYGATDWIFVRLRARLLAWLP